MGKRQTNAEIDFKHNRIVYLLLTEKTLTAATISERVGVSVEVVKKVAKSIMCKIASEDALGLTRDPRFKRKKYELRQWGFHGVTK